MMAPEQWARIKEVLASVLEQPEEERGGFLNNYSMDNAVVSSLSRVAGRWRG